MEQSASGQTLYNLQHLLSGDFAIVFFLFSTTSSFKIVGLHRLISSKLVSVINDGE
jgi:hypothetical protein